MNKGVLVAAAMAFAIPVGLMLVLNIGQLKPETSEAVAKPKGKLLYFYSPS